MIIITFTPLNSVIENVIIIWNNFTITSAVDDIFLRALVEEQLFS